MTHILIAIVFSGIVSGGLIYYSGTNYHGRGTLAGLFGVILAFATAVTGLAYVFVGWSWFASEHATRIINREYGTNYSHEEVFWASNVIDTVRELDRKRVELNGNIMGNDGECQ